MPGFDADRNENGYDNERGIDSSDTNKKTFLQNIVINPSTSSWFAMWNFIIHVFLMIGYFFDPYHLAINVTSFYAKNSDPNYEVIIKRNEIMIPFVIDVFITISIGIKCITAY